MDKIIVKLTKSAFVSEVFLRIDDYVIHMFFLCFLLCAEGSKDAALALVAPIPENKSLMRFNLIPEIGSMRAKSFRFTCAPKSRPTFWCPLHKLPRLGRTWKKFSLGISL